MLSVIIGDIVGSRFEFMSTQEKDIEFFHRACSFTDDTVCTAAISLATAHILDVQDMQQKFIKYGYTNIENKIKNFCEKEYILQLKTICKLYPMAGYGNSFQKWLDLKNPSPYNSLGNGALMRCSGISFLCSSLKETHDLTSFATQITHNHEEAVKCVHLYSELLFNLKQASISLLSSEEKKKLVQDFMKSNDLSIKSVEEYNKEGGFHVLCMPTFERALASYIEADSLENTIKNCLYIGSDTDTTSAIAGPIAEYTWGIPEDFLEKTLNYFDHKNIFLLKTICNTYETSNIWNTLNINTQNFIKKVKTLVLIDPTAQYDPLELPSDELYYGKHQPKKGIWDIIKSCFHRK